MLRARKMVHCPENNFIRASQLSGTIAFLDTGVSQHPDLTSNRRLLAFKDFIYGNKLNYDDSGHGTHVCGIACGSGNASNGTYRGIAPSANFIMGKVLDKKGNGSVIHMLNGLEWIARKKDQYDIKVLNISIGISEIEDIYKTKLLLSKIQEISNAGILVVCAAGNNGPLEGSMSMIGNLEDVVIVGCHDGKEDKYHEGCHYYSARGNPYSRIKKPDVVAPGTHIISCNKKCKKIGNYYHNAYTIKNGTSMATPLVAGAGMFYLQLHPDAPNLFVKQKIIENAIDLGEPWTKQGKGMLNISKMIEE